MKPAVDDDDNKPLVKKQRRKSRLPSPNSAVVQLETPEKQKDNYETWRQRAESCLPTGALAIAQPIKVETEYFSQREFGRIKSTSKQQLNTKTTERDAVMKKKRKRTEPPAEEDARITLAFTPEQQKPPLLPIPNTPISRSSSEADQLPQKVLKVYKKKKPTSTPEDLTPSVKSNESDSSDSETDVAENLPQREKFCEFVQKEFILDSLAAVDFLSTLGILTEKNLKSLESDEWSRILESGSRERSDSYNDLDEWSKLVLETRVPTFLEEFHRNR